MKKLDNLLLNCSSCNLKVLFDLIDSIECDWGEHVVIQCTNCEELFSIDHRCPAFSSILKLIELNKSLMTEQEKIDYDSLSHPC